MEAIKENVSLSISIIQYLFLVVILLTTISCNTNNKSIPLTNIKILYEKDAVLFFALNKMAWDYVACPEYNDSKKISNSWSPQQMYFWNDSYGCTCLQEHGWKKIKNLSEIELHNPSPLNINFIWLKGEFFIPDDPNNYMGVYFKYIYGREIIYINNTLIGIREIENIRDVHLPSQHKIINVFSRSWVNDIHILPQGVSARGKNSVDNIVPPGFLVKGKNIVDIRLEISDRKGISEKTRILLQHDEDYYRTKSWNTFKYNDIYGINLVLIVFSIIVLIIHIILDKEQKPKSLLIFAAVSIYILMALAITMPYENLYHAFHLALLYPVNCIYGLIFMLFFQMQYGLYLPRENKIIFSVIGTCTLLYVILGIFVSVKSYNSLKTVYTIISVFMYLCSFIMIGFILNKLNSINPNRFKLYFFTLITVIFTIQILYDFIGYSTGYLYWPSQMTVYVFPLYLLSFVFYMTFELVIKRIHLKQLYNNLGKDSARQSAGLTITESSKEKLAYVIEFIKDNYFENISREGLAAAVNINPNYLSSLFNAYTGKKFHEYINTLRIKKAAELLKGTEQKIIDIALSVGFENQSTFIRLFKKEMGKTPREYREEN